MYGLAMVPVGAQTTLDDCIRYAWEHQASIQHAAIEVKEARADRTVAWGSFLPRVSAQAEVGRRVGRSLDPMTNGYTNDSYNQGTVGMEVTLSLFEGFARLQRLSYARKTVEEKQWNQLAVQNEVAYRVMEAYGKALLDEQLEQLAEEQRKLGEQYLKEVEVQEALGLKSAADRREVEARYQGDVYRCQSYRKSRRLSLLYLKELMGMEEADSLSLCLPSEVTDRWVCEPPIANDIYGQSLAVLPRYKALELREKAAHRRYAAAWGPFTPSVYARFSWGSDYYDSLYSLHQLRNRWSKYIGIGISFPLLTGMERYAEVRKKKLAWQRTRHELQQERLHLHTETERVIQSLQADAEEYRQLCLQVAAEEQVLKETKRRWEEGLVSVFVLMEARNRLLAAKAERMRVQLQYALASRLADYYRTGTFMKGGNRYGYKD